LRSASLCADGVAVMVCAGAGSVEATLVGPLADLAGAVGVGGASEPSRFIGNSPADGIVAGGGAAGVAAAVSTGLECLWCKVGAGVAGGAAEVSGGGAAAAVSFGGGNLISTPPSAVGVAVATVVSLGTTFAMCR
jgi:hypothetical protein